MANKTRKKSPLATFEKLSPNRYAPRNKSIRRLTPHCVAGNLTIESTLGLSNFQSGGNASTNYAIGTDGRIGLGVEENYGPWTSSSEVNDRQALTFEIANNGTGPDWRMSDAAINAWLDLSVEICRFYDFSKVNYVPKPDNIAISQVETWIKTWAKDDEMIVTLHNWFKAKACPGPYFMRQLPWLVREMNKRLQDPKWIPEAFVGEGSGPTVVAQPPTQSTTSSSTKSSSSTNSADYQVTINTSALNVRKGPGSNYAVTQTLINDKNTYTIVEEASGTGATKWGRLKSGAGWVSLDFVKKK